MENQHDIAPHKCPACGHDAYVGMNEVECVNVFCRNFHDETAARWDAAAPKKTEELTTGAQVRDKYFDCLTYHGAEEDTEPQLNLGDQLLIWDSPAKYAKRNVLLNDLLKARLLSDLLKARKER